MLWSYRRLREIDRWLIAIVLALMAISIVVLSSFSAEVTSAAYEETFFTAVVWQQLRWFALSWCCFFLCAGFDYNKLREWSVGLYLLTLAALIGLFFAPAIQQVHRWYRMPFLGISFQPSEFAKFTVLLALSWFLERHHSARERFSTAFSALGIVGLPALLILKEPDLGTALVFFPLTLLLFYLGGIHRGVVQALAWSGSALLVVVALLFTEVVSHEAIRPYALQVMKDYQFDRLDPATHHQRAAATAIAVGGLFGKGWRHGDFSAGGWLPTPYTDSVFPAFGEEFGFLGLLLLLALFYALIYRAMVVAIVAPNRFGELVAAGIAGLIAIHVMMNVGMMTGFLPITGVPLLFITYGGSSVIFTMSALGVLQSIYTRRFVF